MRAGTFVHENIRISWRSIRSNPLRTILTILIIAIGLMALVGILTAIDSITGSINSTFSMMGANTFTIRNRDIQVHMGGPDRTRVRNNPNITYKQALDFQQQFGIPSTISFYLPIGGAKIIRGNGTQTNPNISIISADENFLGNSGYEIEKGRNFSRAEVENLNHVALIGQDIAKKLFPNKPDPTGEYVVSVGGKYKVIGLLKSKGKMMGGGTDRMVVIPVTLGKTLKSLESTTFSILVKPINSEYSATAPSQAEGLFRAIRQLKPTDASDFNIIKSDAIAKVLIENLEYVRWAATIIGLITLLGAAVGLMNIMLVAVAERTQEIGTRKALGATSGNIRQQFLFESIMICLMGGFMGILLGVLLGNVVSKLTGSPFVIPFNWIGIGFLLSFGVGIAAGFFPAVKAAKLDPIEALRYE